MAQLRTRDQQGPYDAIFPLLLFPLNMKTSLLSAWRRAASTLTKEAGDISSVFPSLSGKKPDPLPPRFSDLKKSLIKGNEEALTESWQRLLASLKTEIEEIRSEGSNVCRHCPSTIYLDPQLTDVSRSYRVSSTKMSLPAQCPRLSSTPFAIAGQP